MSCKKASSRVSDQDYDNTPSQCHVLFHGDKNDNFQMNFFYFFLRSWLQTVVIRRF